MFVGRLKTEVPKSLEIMTNALADKEVIEINASDNAMGPVGVQSIEGPLKALKPLKSLLISNNGLGPVIDLFIKPQEGAEKLCEALIASENKLEAIEIGRNRLENKGAKALSLVLSDKKTFTKLNVQQNGIKKDGTVELLRSIRENTGMEELYLNDNWVKGEEAIDILDDIIRICTKLRILNLSDNNIGDLSSEKIFESLLKYNSPIEKLYYNYNELSEESTIRKCLDSALKLANLKVLEIEGNEISKKLAALYKPEFEKRGVDCKFRGEDEDEEEEGDNSD